MATFSIDIKVAATMYIKADTEEAAKALVNELSYCKGVSVIEVADTDLDVLGDSRVKLSPAMTSYGVWEGEELQECDFDLWETAKTERS